jgi:hypothetical protein
VPATIATSAHKPDRDNREDPAPAPDIDHEQHEREERDHHQQTDGGKLRLDVGVTGTIDEATGGPGQLVATEPVVRPP